ncbi:MAG TPA: hypothetical protein DDW52_09925 [Planctomycetaceae bacterium]|nr:hypothetical protein [Planctomycetaceae bacterium]
MDDPTRLISQEWRKQSGRKHCDENNMTKATWQGQTGKVKISKDKRTKALQPSSWYNTQFFAASCPLEFTSNRHEE